MTESEVVEKIKSLAGWPEIPVVQEDLNIIKFHVLPQIKQYYKWFPLTDYLDVPVSGQSEIAAPVNSIGLLSYEFLKNEGYGTESSSASSFDDPFQLSRITRKVTGRGSSYVQTTIEERFTRDSVRGYNRVQSVNYADGRVKIFSNIPSICALKIAKIGTLNDIPQDNEEIFTMFAAVSFLKKEIMIRSAVKISNGVDVDTSYLSETVSKLEESLELKKSRRLSMSVLWG